MGLIYADIELANAKNGSLKSITVNALVDTGAMTLCIPEHIAIQLQLHEIEKREVTTANERRHVVPYVGPVQVRFANRTCFTGALVIGESVLLVLSTLRRIVRMGQTNFQFASIWEDRRTREVLIAGFRTLGEAVNKLGPTIENSVSNLQASISSDVAKLVDEEIRARDVLSTRLLEQNRMLDNIQSHRAPNVTDRPSRY